MFPFLPSLLLLLWVVGGILGTGVALLRLSSGLRGLPLLVYGTAAGVALHGIFGWLIALAPHFRGQLAMLLVALQLASLGYLIFGKILFELARSLASSIKIALLLWLLFLVACVGLTHLQVRYPDSLEDGLYISKAHNTNVKIQYLTGLAADNYIPFAVAEFIVRGVPFKTNRPILPGNEVSNRTVLMSLVVVPFRVALGAPRDRPRLGFYKYIELLGSNVWVLNVEPAFGQFEVIGLTLNGLLFLGVLLFCSSLGMEAAFVPASLLLLSNPFFISQTIFTWPKAMAGFFILLAWNSLRSRHSSVVVGLLMGLAYHSHPYALIFAGFLGLFYLVQKHKARWRIVTSYFLSFALTILPWFIWTQFTLRLPANLVTQNFLPFNDFNSTVFVNFIWIRLYHLGSMLGPTMLGYYPFALQPILDRWMYWWLPSVIGLSLFLPAAWQCRKLSATEPWIWYGLAGPAVMLLAVLSVPALPTFLGYQSLLAVIIFFGVYWLQEHRSSRACFYLLGLQLITNLTVLLLRGVVVGAHFS